MAYQLVVTQPTVCKTSTADSSTLPVNQKGNMAVTTFRLLSPTTKPELVNSHYRVLLDDADRVMAMDNKTKLGGSPGIYVWAGHSKITDLQGNIIPYPTP